MVEPIARGLNRAHALLGDERVRRGPEIGAPVRTDLPVVPVVDEHADDEARVGHGRVRRDLARGPGEERVPQVHEHAEARAVREHLPHEARADGVVEAEVRERGQRREARGEAHVAVVRGVEEVEVRDAAEERLREVDGGVRAEEPVQGPAPPAQVRQALERGEQRGRGELAEGVEGLEARAEAEQRVDLVRGPEGGVEKEVPDAVAEEAGGFGAHGLPDGLGHGQTVEPDDPIQERLYPEVHTSGDAQERGGIGRVHQGGGLEYLALQLSGEGVLGGHRFKCWS